MVWLEKQYLVTSVSDTGVGITEENLEKLFSCFGKLEDKKLINKGGLGLGLNISKSICESLGGRIEVKS